MKLIPQFCATDDSTTFFPSLCGRVGRFTGIENTSIRQGTDFDLLEGVTAYDEYDDVIPFTVSPSEVDSCQVGAQTFVYASESAVKERTVTVTQIPNPTISGASTTLEVEAGEEFDPLDGVTAVDGNGNTVTVTATLVQ